MNGARLLFAGFSEKRLRGAWFRFKKCEKWASLFNYQGHAISAGTRTFGKSLNLQNDNNKKHSFELFKQYIE